jgi:hypothetical protein
MVASCENISAASVSKTSDEQFEICLKGKIERLPLEP